MRILQVGPIPPEVGGRTGGGVARHLWDLAAHLVELGHTVGVLGTNYYPDTISPEHTAGMHSFGFLGLGKSIRTAYLVCPSFWIKLIRVKIHFGALKSWKEVLSGLLNYYRVLKEFQPEIIHIHHLEYRFPFVYYLVADRIPILTTVHSTSMIEDSQTEAPRKGREFVRRNLILARNLIFVSQFLKDRFTSIFPGILEDKNTAIIHNPVDGSLFYPIDKKGARERLG